MVFFWRKNTSEFSGRSTAEDVTQGIDGSGLTAIITGSSSGMGAEAARVLALRGVHVVMAVRNVESGTKAKENIVKEIPNAKIDVMPLDVSSLASVRNFASKYNSLGLPLNILINNAGIMATPFALSVDGIEMQFATNHLGHFHLTNLLLENMKNTARNSQQEGRIVIVSSDAHKFAYKGIDFDLINDKPSHSTYYSYGISKLANILHARELAKRLKEEGANVTVNSLHPGFVATHIFNHNKFVDGMTNSIGKLFLKNVAQGAATHCYLALNPQVAGVSGEYFSDCKIAASNAYSTNADLAKKLWEYSLNLTNRK